MHNPLYTTTCFNIIIFFPCTHSHTLYSIALLKSCPSGSSTPSSARQAKRGSERPLTARASKGSKVSSDGHLQSKRSPGRKGTPRKLSDEPRHSPEFFAPHSRSETLEQVQDQDQLSPGESLFQSASQESTSRLLQVCHALASELRPKLDLVKESTHSHLKSLEASNSAGVRYSEPQAVAHPGCTQLSTDTTSMWTSTGVGQPGSEPSSNGVLGTESSLRPVSGVGLNPESGSNPKLSSSVALDSSLKSNSKPASSTRTDSESRPSSKRATSTRTDSESKSSSKRDNRRIGSKPKPNSKRTSRDSERRPGSKQASDVRMERESGPSSKQASSLRMDPEPSPSSKSATAEPDLDSISPASTPSDHKTTGEGTGKRGKKAKQKVPGEAERSNHYKSLLRWEGDLAKGDKAEHGPVLYVMDRMPEVLTSDGTY